jgi:hypothetical protein
MQLQDLRVSRLRAAAPAIELWIVQRNPLRAIRAELHRFFHSNTA